MKHKHHVIPRHIGGTDDPDNIIELTIEEHAEAHRVLFEEAGRWQDYVAWQGLLQLTGKEELLTLRTREGAAITNAGYWKKEENRIAASKRAKERGLAQDQSGAKNPNAKRYLVTHPDGTEEDIFCLKDWCVARGLNHNTFHGMCVSRGRSFKGFTAKKFDDAR